MKPLILLEFNELCEPLIARWIAEGELPNFKKLKESSAQYTTIADAEPPALEPWIQWYSMHTGLPYAEHQVFSLTEGQHQSHPDIWEELRVNGLKTFNCGSMNTKACQDNNAIYLPDPWCTDNKPSPASFSPYYNFVSEQVQNQSARQSLASQLGQITNFGWFMLKNGLTFNTVSKTLGHLFKEKLSKDDIYWKRAFILDWLQTDVFISTFKKNKPQFSTFFLNSTAHTQHSFWRFLEPEKFDINTDSQEYHQYKNAVLTAYKNMDGIIERFIELAGDDVTLALATGLSQKAYLSDGAKQVFYRFHDVDNWVNSLGFSGAQVNAVMTHQYIFHGQNASDNERFKALIESITFDSGEKVFDYNIKDDGAIYFGTRLTRLVSDSELVNINGSQITFESLLYKINESKSGCHHPEGIFWIQEQKAPAQPEIPVTKVNTFIREHFNLQT